MTLIGRRKFHISTDIAGLLKLTDYRLGKMLPYIKCDGCPCKSVRELKHQLAEEILLGHKYIAAEGCDNFSPFKGCLGHPVKEEVTGDA